MNLLKSSVCANTPWLWPRCALWTPFPGVSHPAIYVPTWKTKKRYATKLELWSTDPQLSTSTHWSGFELVVFKTLNCISCSRAASPEASLSLINAAIPEPGIRSKQGNRFLHRKIKRKERGGNKEAVTCESRQWFLFEVECVCHRLVSSVCLHVSQLPETEWCLWERLDPDVLRKGTECSAVPKCKLSSSWDGNKVSFRARFHRRAVCWRK